MKKELLPYVVGAVLLVGALGYVGYQWKLTTEKLLVTEAELASSTRAVQNATTDNQQLSEALSAEKERNDAFQGKIDALSGTVGKLDKLAKIDPELLQKYSKVFFLSENYIPELTQIPQKFISDSKDEYFQKEAWTFLEDMLQDAQSDGIDLRITSAYRSFGTQSILKSSYTVTYGSGANAFSADQGYSEHQLGTTIDFTSAEINGALAGFDSTEAYAWLQKRAYRYGFVLSYPKGNGYYQYEPWHWRFVGRDLAKTLHSDDKHFYDLEQREIDTYLIDLFD